MFSVLVRPSRGLIGRSSRGLIGTAFQRSCLWSATEGLFFTVNTDCFLQ